MSCDPGECKSALESTGGEKVGFSCTPRGCSDVQVGNNPSFLTFTSNNGAVWKLKCNQGKWNVTSGSNGKKCECVESPTTPRTPGGAPSHIDKNWWDFVVNNKSVMYGIVGGLILIIIVAVCLAFYFRQRRRSTRLGERTNLE